MESAIEPECKFAAVIDNVIQWIGRVSSSLNVFLMVAIIAQVVMRYGFGKGMVELEELQWHFYCVNVVFGLSYCLSVDSHIRLDLIHDKLSRRTKEKIEMMGIIILLMPLIAVFLIHSIDFLWEAIRTNERSDSPVGLCCRWIPKGLIPISMLMLLAAATARLAKAFTYLKHTKKGV